MAGHHSSGWSVPGPYFPQTYVRRPVSCSKENGGGGGSKLESYLLTYSSFAATAAATTARPR